MSSDNDRINRRRVLFGLAVPPATLLGAGLMPGSGKAAPPAEGANLRVAAAQPGCILTPQSDDGPYFLDSRLVRQAISEDRQGVPLTLEITLVDAGQCVPVAGARVDIWHADARGAYSGYNGQGDERASTAGKTYLRGTQMSDAQGLAGFQTIYPGWYEGRAPHIHAKVFLKERSVFSCQLFLPDALNEFLYTNVPAYMGRMRTRDTLNCNDPLVRNDQQHLTFCSVREAPDRYIASVVLGLNPAAPPPAEDFPPVGFLITRALGITPGGKITTGAARIKSLVPGLGD